MGVSVSHTSRKISVGASAASAVSSIIGGQTVSIGLVAD